MMYNHCLEFLNSKHQYMVASFPGPAQLFVACSTEKSGNEAKYMAVLALSPSPFHVNGDKNSLFGGLGLSS